MKIILNCVILVLLCCSCENNSNTALKDKLALQQDVLFCDTSALDATILFDGKNFLRITVLKNEPYSEGTIFVHWDVGFYTTNKDTIYISSVLNYSNKEYAGIKTKYFWTDTNNAVGMQLFKDPEELADSLFHINIPRDSSQVSMSSFAYQRKALIKKNKLIHL